MTRRNVLSIACCLLMVGAVFAQNKPEHKYFKTSDGVKIHFMVKGKGTPVILIHGYTGSAEGNWFSNGIADALAVNHMVIAIDCRNHGLSDKPQPMGPGKAEDVIELMDHLNVVLPGKWRLTAIMAGYMPKEYLESVVKFINANDPKQRPIARR